MSNDDELTREAYAKLGELASTRRIEMGLTSMELATVIGVNFATLTSFEHGLGADAGELARIEVGLDWGPGIVERVVAEVQSGRFHPKMIQMEHLDEEDTDL